MPESNLWATILAVFGTGVVTFVVTRLSKGHDARGQAEAALIGTGPTIIAEQNRRISGMQKDLDRMWVELQEMAKRERKCRDDLAETRFELKGAQQAIIALEYKLGNHHPPDAGGELDER